MLDGKANQDHAQAQSRKTGATWVNHITWPARRTSKVSLSLTAAIVTAAIAAAVTACSSTRSLPAQSASHPTGTSSPRPSMSDAPAPTGDQLGAWLTSLKLPDGWSRSTGASGGLITSGAITTPHPGPNHTQSTCEAIDFGDQASEVLEWWSMSGAAI